MLQQLLVRHFAQLIAQGRHRVVAVVQRIAQQQEAALLGGEQEYQAHHHRERGFVEKFFADTLEQRALAVGVDAVHRLDQYLDRFAHLRAELLGDLLLVLRALGQQRGQHFFGWHTEESRHAQQGAKCAKGERFFAPQACVPGDEGGGFARTCGHQHPVRAIGHQAERHAGGVQQGHHSCVWRCGLPGCAGHRMVEALTARIGLDE